MRTWLLLSVSLVAGLLVGCGTAPHRIDATGNEGLTTTDEINFKDWQMTAEKSINSMLQAGVLDRADGRKSVIMVSTVRNSTSQHINTQILTQKIRTAVLRSGKAITTTAVGAAGAEDAATRQVRDLQEDEMFDQRTVQPMGTVISPDFSLSGEITQQSTTLGRASESYFYFHMVLTDLKTGLGVWEDEVEVAKQQTRGVLGL
jgi:hypothetical protein